VGQLKSSGRNQMNEADLPCGTAHIRVSQPAHMTYMQRPFLFCALTILPFQSEAAVSVQIGQNFTASTFQSDVFSKPPDPDGVVGPSHYVELINGRFSIYDKATGTNVRSITDRTFWAQAGVDLTGVNISDPRIIFDKSVNRWFASQIDFNLNNLVSNRFLLAISATNDPTGAWNAVTFQADPGGTFADFPTLGLDANGVYLGGNMFDAGEKLLGVLLASVPKADLLQPTPTAANRSTTGLVPIGTFGFTLQPVVNFSPTNGPENVVAVDSDGTDFLLHNTLKMFQVLNAGASNAAFTPPANLTVPQFFVPLDPPQPDGMSTLSDGDSRIGAISYQVGNIIYAVHSTQGTRTEAQWFKISAIDNSILQTGIISDTNLHLIYPSIAANENGLVVIAFDACSSNTFVGSCAVAGETINGTTTFGDITLLKSGAANYEVVEPNGESRWGDYTATSVDPQDPNSFWTIQQYVSTNNIYSTQVTQLRLTQLPALQIALATNSFVLSWPTNYAGFTVQSTTNLASSSWSNVTNGVSVVGSQNTVTVAAASPAQFFRLQK